MNRLREWCKRVAGMFHKERRDAELAEELASHLEMLVEQNVERGMTPEEARRAARIALGGREQIKEAVREQRGLPFLESLIADVRFGLRMLRKSPGFTCVAILTLALGIGANTAIFSVVNGILLEPLPYAGSSRLLRIANEFKVRGIPMGLQGASLPEIADVQAQSTVFERLAIYQEHFGGTIRTDLMPDTSDISEVSADFFPMMGVKPLLGRPITAADEQGGGQRVAVLSYRMWQEDFGGDANVLTRTFLVDGTPYRVIGVMPPEFNLGVGKGFWKPLMPSPKIASSRAAGARYYSIVARLKKGVTLKQASAQLQIISARLAAEYPETEKGLDLEAEGIKDQMVTQVRAGLLILLGAVGFVLLIACVNVSALLVARAWTRQREMAIRRALGATRLRLVRQMLSESVLLAIAGGALGLLFAASSIGVICAIAPPYTPRIERVRLDSNVLWFTLGISLLAAMLFGIAPALQASARRMGHGIKEGLGGSFATGAPGKRRLLRGSLVTAEVSLAVIVVLGAALMVRSFEKLMHVDTGIRTDHVLTMHARFSHAVCSAKTADACAGPYEDALGRIQSLSGVQSAAISQGFALMGGRYVVDDLYVEGSSDNQMAKKGAELGAFLSHHSVTPSYFETVGIRLLEGRNFTNVDTDKSALVAIVNQRFASDFLNGNALGQRIAVTKDKAGNPEWMQIVGVVSDDRDTSLKKDPEPLYYQPARQVGYIGTGDFVIRTSGNPLAIAPVIEKQVWAVDSNAPILGLRTMDQNIANSAAEPRFQSSLLTSFGALGLLLAMIGLYGVMSYAVVQRTHEIGVRMALGASRLDVMRLVVGEGAGLALIGVASGLAASWALMRFLRSLLFEVSPTDPVSFAGVGVLLMFVAIAASWIPARRAMRVDPMVALRHE